MTNEVNHRDALDQAAADAVSEARGSQWVTRFGEVIDLRQNDVVEAAHEAREILTRCRTDASPIRKWAAQLVALSGLEGAAQQIDADHGPMSEGRAELIIARAQATLDGNHAAAEALGRELVGVR